MRQTETARDAGTPRAPAPDALRRRVEELRPWFHNIYLPGGVQTAPDHWLGDFPRFKWEQIAPHLPGDLHGRTVLDIGCNAGFYSFELAQRGAKVTAIDSDPHYLRQGRWVRDVLGLQDRVTFRQMQVYDLAREPGRYDVVLFMGVLYHLRFPLLALEAVGRATRELLVLQSLTMDDGPARVPPPDLPMHRREELTAPGWPKAAFVEHRLQDDPTNWWVFNAPCIEAMLRSVGMTPYARPADEFFFCRPAPDGGPWRDIRDAEYHAAIGRPEAVSGPS